MQAFFELFEKFRLAVDTAGISGDLLACRLRLASPSERILHVYSRITQR
jgi:hypothetical protein